MEEPQTTAHFMASGKRNIDVVVFKGSLNSGHISGVLEGWVRAGHDPEPSNGCRPQGSLGAPVLPWRRPLYKPASLGLSLWSELPRRAANLGHDGAAKRSLSLVLGIHQVEKWLGPREEQERVYVEGGCVIVSFVENGILFA